ncbi:septal ring lytic transglycosylase RlpA family protein [Sphingomonas aliaeris]|uniref:septal ring lytic transglycosylase RlpA family protein n=1 Tax=Sphingomonas aliaeris TaxID=2759526 RepID=UPI001CEC1A05|nr:septal ring lytic transglycosylase RlpA family protein [Sphingomonas aliaeris]
MPPDIASVEGPRGTSGQSQRYDTVGYATWYGEEMQGSDTASGQPFDPAGITAAHRTLPLGSIVEVTALDTGRTILALVNDRGPGRPDLEIDLSRGAAQSLGVTGVAPVRIRRVTANSPDIMALRGGQAASRRIDAPQALLVALRRKLPVRAGVAIASKGRFDAPALPVSPPSREDRIGQNAGTPAATVAPNAGSNQASSAPGAFVQVAALSHEGRAKALATMLHGRVHRVGTIFRVQMGPYANGALAKAARDDVARRGYGDARIVQTN